MGYTRNYYVSYYLSSSIPKLTLEGTISHDIVLLLEDTLAESYSDSTACILHVLYRPIHTTQVHVYSSCVYNIIVWSASSACAAHSRSLWSVGTCMSVVLYYQYWVQLMGRKPWICISSHPLPVCCYSIVNSDDLNVCYIILYRGLLVARSSDDIESYAYIIIIVNQY